MKSDKLIREVSQTFFLLLNMMENIFINTQFVLEIMWYILFLIQRIKRSIKNNIRITDFLILISNITNLILAYLQKK